MTETRYDVLGVGNAIVDVIARCSDDFLVEHGIEKGGMTLIDEDQATSLYAAMGEGTEISGGSGANTLAGIASFGGRGAYIGKVAEDALGDTFDREIRTIGVDYQTSRLVGGAATARCLVNVTEDAQRSMCTFLGASTFFPTRISTSRASRLPTSPISRAICSTGKKPSAPLSARLRSPRRPTARSR